MAATRDDALPEHVRANREAWDGHAAAFAEPGRRNWAKPAPEWGIWSIPEADLRLLPAELTGKDVIELGCGTAYVSAWLARLGARPIGIDVSTAQLETARALQREFGLEFRLHLGNAEATPFEDESFDVAISEYGASLWADPYAWVPEASRLLRPGGWLIFITDTALIQMTAPEHEADGPAGRQLLRRYFGMQRMVWPDDMSVEFHLRPGEWIRLLRETGFEIHRLAEVQAPPDAVADPRWTYVTPEWARQWPSEEAWIARKRG